MRVYLLIVSTNPLIAYFNGEVYMNKCGKKNVLKEFNIHSHICNVVLLRRTLSELQSNNQFEGIIFVIIRNIIILNAYLGRGNVFILETTK